MQALKAFALCATFSLAGAARADDTDLSNVTIKNFHQVDSGLYRSGRPAATEIAQLVPLGVKTIVTLETYVMDPDDADEEAAAAAAAGIKFLRVEMNPLPFYPPTTDQIQAAVDDAVDPANRPVLVHCYEGSDRTGLVIGAYHMEVDHWSADDAIADMRNFGHSFLFYSWDKTLYKFQ